MRVFVLPLLLTARGIEWTAVPLRHALEWSVGSTSTWRLSSGAPHLGGSLVGQLRGGSDLVVDIGTRGTLAPEGSVDAAQNKTSTKLGRVFSELLAPSRQVLKRFFRGAKQLTSDGWEYWRLRKAEPESLSRRQTLIMQQTPRHLLRMLPIVANPLPPPFGFVLIFIANAAPKYLLTPEFWSEDQVRIPASRMTTGAVHLRMPWSLCTGRVVCDRKVVHLPAAVSQALAQF